MSEKKVNTRKEDASLFAFTHYCVALNIMTEQEDNSNRVIECPGNTTAGIKPKHKVTFAEVINYRDRYAKRCL
jgi:hypothetical protein